MYTLEQLGFSNFFKDQLNEFEWYNEKDHKIGRVSIEYKHLYKIYGEFGEVLGNVSGKINYESNYKDDYPSVGDFVIVDNPMEGRTVIRKILKRKSKFERKVSGNKNESQIVASNIDILFICMSLNNNFNLKRLERYITLCFDSGAIPIILLTKCDLSHDEHNIEDVKNIDPFIDVIEVSSLINKGIDEVFKYIAPGKTCAFLGSSGVGKSSLINMLMGEDIQSVKEISELGDRGKHTTTNRELLILKSGGIVIDTPGMREIHILDSDEGVDYTFKDIIELSKNCKFNNCTHTTEPGCKVIEALKNGELSEDRLTNFNKLKKEAEFMERKLDSKLKAEYKKQIISRHKEYRQRINKKK